MPLLERARVEVYLPDLPQDSYQNLLTAFDLEFTHAFGGCTINRGLDGSYLSRAGVKTPDRINLIYTDLPLALSTNAESVARYAVGLKQIAFEALAEEAIFKPARETFEKVGFRIVEEYTHPQFEKALNCPGIARMVCEIKS